MRLHVFLVALLLVGCERIPLQGLVSPPGQEESRSGDKTGSSGDASDGDTKSPGDKTAEKLPSDDYLGLRKGLTLQYQTTEISDLGGALGRTEDRVLLQHEVTTVEVQDEQATASIWVSGLNLNAGPITPFATLYFKKRDGLYRKPSMAESAHLLLPFPVKDSVRVIREASSSTHVETVNGYQDTITVMAGAETATTATGKTVVTAAGTFKDCVEVRTSQLTNSYHAEHSKGFFGKVEMGMTITRWFAPGLGLIKYEQIHFTRDPRIDPMSLEYYGELSTYSVPVTPANP